MNVKHLYWVLPFLLLAVSAPTQQPPAVPDAITVTTVLLDRGAGPPNERLWVPLWLTSAPGVKVARLEVTVTFPKASLTFLSLERSGLTDGVEADVKTELKDDEKDASQKLLILRLSTLDGKATRIPFPDGKLVYLIFQVDKRLSPKMTITIGATGNAVTVDSKPVEAFTVRTTTLEVIEEALSACFFFMH